MATCQKCAELQLVCTGELQGCLQCILSGRSCTFAASVSFSADLEALEIASSQGEPWDESLHVATILRPLSMLPNATQFERDAIFHFLRGTSPTLVAMEVPHDNPNYCYFPISVNSSSRALYYALCAAGAGHFKNWGGDVDDGRIRAMERKSIRMLEHDVQDLSQCMAQPSVSDAELREKVSSILAVLQTLILYATTMGDVKLWRKHLQGSSIIIQAASNPGRGRAPVLFDTFLLETSRYLDLLSALSSKGAPSIPSNVVESGWQPNQTVVSSSVTGMHGFSKPLLEIVTRICDLQYQKESATRSFAETERVASEIRHDLELAKAQVASLEQDSTFRTALLQRLSLSNHAEQLDGHFRFAEAIYYACHVHLCRAMAGTAVLDERSMQLVYVGLETITKIPMQGSAGNLLGWALVVLGAELEDDEAARSIVRARMRALGSLGHLNLLQAGQLIEEVWRRKDGRLDRTVITSWQDTMKEMGWDLLVA